MSAPMQDPGEKSLSKLLATLSTILHPTTYVFATVKDEAKLPPVSAIQLFFRETEGLTVITSLDYAKSHGLEYFFPCKMITLDVTSSLEAVGFMAVIATRLATKDMGVNPVSGFYHDHLFVPLGRENEAIEMLKGLAEEKRNDGASWAGDVSHK
ncbi:integron protein cassette protein [Metarhizium guizhouense ARSEF 977]|uniref:Integron protein cassette protein n=1 Tax=Metarhizium guizhouense (strain ARSEF 977) TaxID=1276136 RepID=A0A0B4GKP4_METGA|nr:integron protein cassette protein [Metarhizium guizhouense ARSEF 977]